MLVLRSTSEADDRAKSSSSASISTNIELLFQSAGFGIVLDNIDCCVKHRYMRYTAGVPTVKSIHCVNSYALYNKVNTYHLKNLVYYTCLPNDTLNALSWLPSKLDDEMLRKNFTIHISELGTC